MKWIKKNYSDLVLKEQFKFANAESIRRHVPKIRELMYRKIENDPRYSSFWLFPEFDD